MLEMLNKPVVKIRNYRDTVKIPIDIAADIYCSYTAQTLDSGKHDIGAEFIDEVEKHISRAMTNTLTLGK